MSAPAPNLDTCLGLVIVNDAILWLADRNVNAVVRFGADDYEVGRWTQSVFPLFFLKNRIKIVKMECRERDWWQAFFNDDD
jgi:hypothetical protein